MRIHNNLLIISTQTASSYCLALQVPQLNINMEADKQQLTKIRRYNSSNSTAEEAVSTEQQKQEHTKSSSLS
jgi:hypothetical protein